MCDTATTVVGVDVGTKHLALCALDSAGAVSQWELVDVGVDGKATASECVRACALALDRVEWLASATTIAIESQPFGVRAHAANNKMRCVQSSIEAFAALRVPGAEVVAIGARAKGVGGSTYAERKRDAVRRAADYLTAESADWAAWFNRTAGKRDDLADALLIAIVARERAMPKPRAAKRRKRENAPAITDPTP